jgi:hypothetical protein
VAAFTIIEPAFGFRGFLRNLSSLSTVRF